MVGCSANTGTASAISPDLFWSATHLSIHALLFVLFILRACLAWLATTLPLCVRHILVFYPTDSRRGGRSTTLPTDYEIQSAPSSDRRLIISWKPEFQVSNSVFCYQCYLTSIFCEKLIGKEWRRNVLRFGEEAMMWCNGGVFSRSPRRRIFYFAWSLFFSHSLLLFENRASLYTRTPLFTELLRWPSRV